MKKQVKHKVTGAVILEYEKSLYKANLQKANLQKANLRGALMPMYCKWSVSTIDSDRIRVGCEIKSVQEWKDWLDSDEEFETARGTEEFKRIEANIRAHITYLETLNSK